MTIAAASAPAGNARIETWLKHRAGFAPDPRNGDWLRNGNVRVVFEDEGYVAIYVFDDRHPGAEALASDIKLSHPSMKTFMAVINSL